MGTSSRCPTVTYRLIASATSQSLHAIPAERRCRGPRKAAGTIRGCRSRTPAATWRLSARTLFAELHFTRDLFFLRTQLADLRSGAYAELPSPPGAWAWQRGERTVVAINLGPRRRGARRRRRVGRTGHTPRARGRACRADLLARARRRRHHHVDGQHLRPHGARRARDGRRERDRRGRRGAAREWRGTGSDVRRLPHSEQQGRRHPLGRSRRTRPSASRRSTVGSTSRQLGRHPGRVASNGRRDGRGVGACVGGRCDRIVLRVSGCAPRHDRSQLRADRHRRLDRRRRRNRWRAPTRPPRRP